MKKSLFEFAKNKKEAKDRVEEKKLDKEDIKKKYENYSKMSESELMKELYREVGKQKSNGSFNKDKLITQVDGIKHLLNEKQITDIEKILRSLD